ncbi:MAG: hypothetical protein JWP81_1012 [Ferruginibacter sp.]|nr:hypothetical protein [Ferruginibacter sp.]
MPPLKLIIVVIICLLANDSIKAQEADSSKTCISASSAIFSPVSGQRIARKNNFCIKSWLVPGCFIAYGIASLGNISLQNFNVEMKEEVYLENPHKKIPIDNYLQYTPAAVVYGLNALGLKAKHGFVDRTGIYLISNIILSTTVLSVKKLSHELRPDGSNFSSFPSGHTAEAFASAEFLREEYNDISPWYGIAGYGMAAATGFLRMYNNKHWIGDVVAGAGVGIASTRIAYWLYPKIQHRLFKNKPVNTVFIPTYENRTISVGLIHRFT